MARIVDGRFHSFTRTRMHLSTNGMNVTRLSGRSWSSFADPGGMEGRVGLGATTVSEQSAQDCYMTAVVVVSSSRLPREGSGV